MTSIDNRGRLALEREEIFTRLYKNTFPPVARYISRRGGSFDEAKDVFHDALVIYYEKVIAGSPAININETAYLGGIARHLWLKKHKANLLSKPLENMDIQDDEDDNKPSYNRVARLLEKAGNRCMELLKSFYYDQVPLEDIATAFGFSGMRSATVQKYKCLEKVRETVKQKALTYESFVE
jgi:DNA-directed RNA polymerase specialized sigma24 family protein